VLAQFVTLMYPDCRNCQLTYRRARAQPALQWIEQTRSQGDGCTDDIGMDMNGVPYLNS